MNRLIFFIFLISLTTTSSGADFSTISLKQWTKEELADDHLRFTHPVKLDLVVHLQIDSYDKDNFWKKENLKEDIEKMVTIRKMMSFFLGITDYVVTSYKLDTYERLPRLFLAGSYRRLDDQSIQFSEINFYGKENFLQLKVISEDKLPTDKEIEELIREIKPGEIEIDK